MVQDAPDPTAEDLVHRVLGLVSGGRRALLGIAGAPGAGKTTFADALADRLRDRPPAGLGPDWVARVPMDGFHLADVELTRLGRLGRKGAPDTFDVIGYVALLQRLANDGDEVVYAPAFDRDIEQPVAGSIPIGPSVRLIISEGNYLLLNDDLWARVGAIFREVWYLDLADEDRRRRLISRHHRFGKPEPAAREWALGSDERNADIVTGTHHRASLRVHSDVLGAPSSHKDERNQGPGDEKGPNY